MITLYTFGPAFGLPDPSPFVMKAEVLLKMAGLPYRTDASVRCRREPVRLRGRDTVSAVPLAGA